MKKPDKYIILPAMFAKKKRYTIFIIKTKLDQY